MNKTIGVLGGGQLGKMLFEAGSPMNNHYIFLEKTEDCPASLVCQHQVLGSLKDTDKIKELSSKSDVLTFEIEHVNVGALLDLEKKGQSIIPKPAVLSIIQDKGLQKDFYTQHGIPTLEYKNSTSENLRSNIESWNEDQFVLKHRRGGYDGKGVQLMTKNKFQSLIDNDNESLKSIDGYVIEKMAKEVVEVSVIVAIDQQLNSVTYAPCEMVFDPKSNLMDYLITPSRLSKEINKGCENIAKKTVKAFNSPGLFAVELFVQKDGGIYVNEIAPRPHNSGHHTIESSYTSQYEQLNRILLNQPLGDTSLIQNAITCNIVGPKHINGLYELNNLDLVLQIPGVYIHMYGKKTTSPNRKLGHYTILGKDSLELESKLNRVKELLTIKSN
jgi:5-(carboxyamino)imidazole ribonucleotide synthase